MTMKFGCEYCRGLSIAQRETKVRWFDSWEKLIRHLVHFHNFKLGEDNKLVRR
jgi:hypothetical protein